MTNEVVAVGLDGCPDGWVTVALDADGRVEDVTVVGSADEALTRWPAATVGIDIPIGLVDGARQADAAARALLGWPRSSSVFSAPPRRVVDAWERGEVTTHAEATSLAVATTGKGISQQAWRILPKIAEVDEVAASPDGGRLLEVHPEVAFRTLADAPVARKTSWEGMEHRRALLADRGIDLPGTFDGADRCAPDDVVDAAVVAWVAAGRTAEALVPLPAQPDQRDHDRPIVIWTRRP